jgi:hypothetical protein
MLQPSLCRFWHDERRFKGGADKCLVQQALFAAGEELFLGCTWQLAGMLAKQKLPLQSQSAQQVPVYQTGSGA